MEQQQNTNNNNNIGIVYKIFNIDSPDYKFYIGSTYKSIEQRLREHEYNYKSYLNK
jgi:hypothetical protein